MFRLNLKNEYLLHWFVDLHTDIQGYRYCKNEPIVFMHIKKNKHGNFYLCSAL